MEWPQDLKIVLLIDVRRSYVKFRYNLVQIYVGIHVMALKLLFFEIVMNEVLLRFLTKYASESLRLIYGSFGCILKFLLAPSFKGCNFLLPPLRISVSEGPHNEIAHPALLSSLHSLVLFRKSPFHFQVLERVHLLLRD